MFFLKRNNNLAKLCLVLVLLSFALGIYLLYSSEPIVSADIEIEKEVQLPEIEYSQFDFTLKIDKLKINAPVVADVDAADKEIYFASLEKGVAHMAGTPKPDEKGNMVIFGHSSFYENKPGSFKHIFKTLDRLNTGDEIYIRYKGKDYKYGVEKQELVGPKDVWVINELYDLTLITCWPPGSTEKRLIVFANKS